MILEKIKETLDKEEFACSLCPPTEKSPFDCLLVSLDLDNMKRERILQIIEDHEQLSADILISPAETVPHYIQFRSTLPFKTQDISLNQVASLLFFINQLIDLPGFGLDELSGSIAYRYVWIITTEAIDDRLVKRIVSSILLNLNLFSETIESLAQGKVTFNELLSQIIKFGDQFPFFKNAHIS